MGTMISPLRIFKALGFVLLILISIPVVSFVFFRLLPWPNETKSKVRDICNHYEKSGARVSDFLEEFRKSQVDGLVAGDGTARKTFSISSEDVTNKEKWNLFVRNVTAIPDGSLAAHQSHWPRRIAECEVFFNGGIVRHAWFVDWD